MSGYIYIDCETLPDIEMTQEEREELVRDSVPGNYKKPESIQKWIDNNSEEAFRKLALDPLRGRVLCVAFAIDDGPVHKVGQRYKQTRSGVDLEERALLMHLQNALGEAAERPLYTYKYVGHNIVFDLRMLWLRAVKYDCLALAKALPYDKWDKRAIDTSTLLAGPDPRMYTSLDDALTFFGLVGKGDLDGSKVYDYWLDERYDEIIDYCAEDVERVRRLHQRIQRALG